MSNPQKSATVRVEAIGDGLGIHDWQHGTTFVLNATTCLVWQHCDGRTTARQLAELLQRAFNVSPRQAEELLALALAELDDANLLQRGEPLLPRPSRRQVIRGLTAAGLSVILMPVVSPVSTALAGPTAPPTTSKPPSGPTSGPSTTTAPPATTTSAPPTTTTTAPSTTTAAPPTTTAGPSTTTAPLTTTTTTTAAPTGGTGTGGGAATPEAPAGLLLALGLAPLASLAAWWRRQQRPRADD